MEGIWDFFEKTAFLKFSYKSTVQVNLVVHAIIHEFVLINSNFNIPFLNDVSHEGKPMMMCKITGL